MQQKQNLDYYKKSGIFEKELKRVLTKKFKSIFRKK